MFNATLQYNNIYISALVFTQKSRKYIGTDRPNLTYTYINIFRI